MVCFLTPASGSSWAAPNSLARLLSPSLIPALLFLSTPSDPFPPSFAGFCSLSFHEQRLSSLAPGQHIWTKGSNLRGRRHLASPFPGPAPWLPRPEWEKGAQAALPWPPILGKALSDRGANRPRFKLALCHLSWRALDKLLFKDFVLSSVKLWTLQHLF